MINPLGFEQSGEFDPKVEAEVNRFNFELAIRDIALGAISDLHQRAGVEEKPVDDYSDDEIRLLIIAGNEMDWEGGGIEWIYTSDLSLLTARQREVQERLVGYASDEVEAGMDIGIARELALLKYIIEAEDPNVHIIPVHFQGPLSD
jgi:hypothetical protein